jgi:hypothetical protein
MPPYSGMKLKMEALCFYPLTRLQKVTRFYRKKEKLYAVDAKVSEQNTPSIFSG